MRTGSRWTPTRYAALSALLSLALYAQVPPAAAQIDPPASVDPGVAGVGEEALSGQPPRAAIGVQTDMESRFGELDVDASGGLSEDEVRSDIGLRRRFEALDVNGDGQVQTREFALGVGDQ